MIHRVNVEFPDVYILVRLYRNFSRPWDEFHQSIQPAISIIGKTNRDEIQNQMRLKFARKLQKRNVIEKSRTSYSQKWLSNVN
ncbi:unknown [Bacteroides sp. CAG:770]|nr:unknown [Bacteroides sp. CAG:770]